MNEDFKRVWVWIGKGLAWMLLAFLMVGALGAMWGILQEYWVYCIIAAISAGLWLIAGWLVVRKSRKHG